MDIWEPNFAASTQPGLIDKGLANLQTPHMGVSAETPTTNPLGFLESFSNWMNSDQGRTWFGGVDAEGNQVNGVVPTALAVGGNLWNMYSGMQNLKLAQDQFDFSKSAWTKQYNNQRQLINTQLADRQRARLGANPNGYQSVGDYMKKNGV